MAQDDEHGVEGPTSRKEIARYLLVRGIGPTDLELNPELDRAPEQALAAPVSGGVSGRASAGPGANHTGARSAGAAAARRRRGDHLDHRRDRQRKLSTGARAAESGLFGACVGV